MTLILCSVQAYSQSTANIKVYGICGMCQERIEAAALGVIGITSASWDQPSNMLTYEYQEGLLLLEELHQAMIAVGHDTDLMQSPDDIYENMHGCWKYRE